MSLDRLRAAGWSVAIHNDYMLDGKPHTFWLLTHPDGYWIKGEGATDEDALILAARQSLDRDMARAHLAELSNQNTILANEAEKTVAELNLVRAEAERMRTALTAAVLAMSAASVLPDVAEQYDFTDAIKSSAAALQSPSPPSGSDSEDAWNNGFSEGYKEAFERYGPCAKTKGESPPSPPPAAHNAQPSSSGSDTTGRADITRALQDIHATRGPVSDQGGG